jgi:hypothetical protein
MVSINAQGSIVKTAKALDRELQRDGYTEGFPPGLSPIERAIDAAAARKARCPACRSRGLSARPFHKPGSYRVRTGPHLDSSQTVKIATLQVRTGPHLSPGSTADPSAVDGRFN